MGAVRWIPDAVAPQRYPLLRYFAYGAVLGGIAAASFTRYITYGFEPVPYLYAPIGHYTYVGSSIWTIISPLLFFRVLRPAQHKTRRDKIIGFVTGISWGFATIRVIVYLYEFILTLTRYS